MIKIAICDDDKMVIEKIMVLLIDYEKKFNLNLHIEPYQSGNKLISAVDNGEVYDIIYMDIEMDRINGIDTAKYFRNHEMNLVLIFISSYEKYHGQLDEALVAI